MDVVEAVEAAEDSPTMAEAELSGEKGVVAVEAEVEVVAAEAGDEHHPPPLRRKAILVYFFNKKPVIKNPRLFAVKKIKQNLFHMLFEKYS